MAEADEDTPKINPSEVETLIEKIWQNKLEEQDKRKSNLLLRTLLAQCKGARAVLANLWNVADASIGWLMREFYRLRAFASVLLGAVHPHLQLEIRRTVRGISASISLLRRRFQSHFSVTSCCLQSHVMRAID